MLRYTPFHRLCTVTFFLQPPCRKRTSSCQPPDILRIFTEKQPGSPSTTPLPRHERHALLRNREKMPQTLPIPRRKKQILRHFFSKPRRFFCISQRFSRNLRAIAYNPAPRRPRKPKQMQWFPSARAYKHAQKTQESQKGSAGMPAQLTRSRHRLPHPAAEPAALPHTIIRHEPFATPKLRYPTPDIPIRGHQHLRHCRGDFGRYAAGKRGNHKNH